MWPNAKGSWSDSSSVWRVEKPYQERQAGFVDSAGIAENTAFQEISVEAGELPE
jgi:hypothetical protein